jgi:hypothetical protein
MLPKTIKELPNKELASPNQVKMKMRNSRNSENNTKMTFKKKYLRNRGNSKNMKAQSNIILESKQNESPLLIYKSSKEVNSPIFFKSDSFRRNKSSELQQIESIQNMKYKITNLMCKTD